MPLFKNRKNSLIINPTELAFIFFILTRIIALFFSFPCLSDVLLYFNVFTNLHLEASPYSQFTFEYPPLSIVPIYLSGWLLEDSSFTSYFLCFASIMFFCDFCCLAICQNFCKNRLAMSNNDIAHMTLLYSLFGLILFRILYHRLDVIVALFFASSLMLFQAKKPQLSVPFFINGLLGFFYKIVPAITMPAAIIFKAFSASDLKKTILKICLNSVIFISCLAAITVFLEIHSHHHFIKNMLLHDQRGIQVESVYSSFLMLINPLLGQPLTINLFYTGFDIVTHPYFEKITKYLGNAVLLIFFFSLFIKLVQQKRCGQKIEISEKNFLDVTLISLLLFLAFQRVLSAQFFIWLIPITSIWLVKNRSILFLLSFAFLFLATFFIFSIDYYALICQIPILVTTLFLRNLCLLITTYLITAKFFKHDFRK